MSTTFTLLHTAGSALTAVPVGQLVRSASVLALLGGVGMVFRPLLVGLGRAVVLAVRPRPPKLHLAKRH